MMTAGIEFIRNEMDWDKYDPWASVMSALFDLCEAWYGSTGEIIEGYRPSPSFSQEEWETERAGRLYEAMEAGIIIEQDMMYWLDVLNRVHSLVILAGRDY